MNEYGDSLAGPTPYSKGPSLQTAKKYKKWSKTKRHNWRKGSHNSDSYIYRIFLPELCLFKGIFFLLFMGFSSSYLWDFLPWVMGSSRNEYTRWTHLNDSKWLRHRIFNPAASFGVCILLLGRWPSIKSLCMELAERLWVCWADSLHAVLASQGPQTQFPSLPRTWESRSHLDSETPKWR